MPMPPFTGWWLCYLDNKSLLSAYQLTADIFFLSSILIKVGGFSYLSTLRKFACQAADHAMSLSLRLSVEDSTEDGALLYRVHRMEYSSFR